MQPEADWTSLIRKEANPTLPEVEPVEANEHEEKGSQPKPKLIGRTQSGRGPTRSNSTKNKSEHKLIQPKANRMRLVREAVKVGEGKEKAK